MPDAPGPLAGLGTGAVLWDIIREWMDAKAPADAAAKKAISDARKRAKWSKAKRVAAKNSSCKNSTPMP